MNALLLIGVGIIIGAGGVVGYQLATPGNEEKQIRALARRMKKASLVEKKKLKEAAKGLIDKI